MLPPTLPNPDAVPAPVLKKPDDGLVVEFDARRCRNVDDRDGDGAEAGGGADVDRGRGSAHGDRERGNAEHEARQ